MTIALLRKRKSAIRQGLDLLRKLGDRASVFVPGAGQPVGPVNLLLYSSDFTNGAWGKGAGISSLVGGLADPYGGTYATRITPVSGAGCYLAQNVSLLNSTTYTRVAIIKPETDSIVAMEFVDNGAYTNTIFNANTLAVSGTATAGASVTPMGGGWFICLRTWTTGPTGTQGAGAWYTNNYGAATSTNTLLIHRLATMQGVVTPAQVIASGIPLTAGTAAAASYLPWVQGASLTPTGGSQSIGPELAINGDFSNGTTGWTLWQPTVGIVQAEAGGCRIRSTDGSFAQIQQSGLTLSIGSTYRISFAVKGWVSGRLAVTTDGTNTSYLSASGPGTYTFDTTVTAVGVLQFKRPGGETCDLIVDDISCKLVTTSPSAAWLMDYVESAMSTAAAVDGPVGALTDGLGAIGPNLMTNPGGPFVSTSGWSANNSGALAIAGGLMTVTNPGANYGGTVAQISTIPGRRYLIEYSACIQSGALSWLLVGDAVGGNSFGTVTLPTSLPGRPLTFSFVATSVNTYVTFQNNNVAGYALTIASITAKQLTGNYATQGTGANKPTLRGGLLNLLLNNKDPSQSGWGALNATYTLGQLDSSGGASAFKIVDNETSGQHHVYNTFSASVNLTPYTFAAVVRAGEHPAVLLDMSDLTLGDAYCAFNLATGAVMGQGGNPWTATSSSIASLGGGWYLCAISATRNSTGNASIRGFVRLNNGVTDVFTGSGTSGIFCDGIGMFRGALTAQQIVALGGIPKTTTAAASGKAGNSRLEYTNGGTQSLALQSAPFAVADDHVIIQGLTVQDTAGTHASFAMANGNSRFPVLYVSAGGYPAVSWRDDTGVGVTITASQASNGDSFVFTGRRVGTTGYARKNGTPYQVAITGLGTTTATAAFIGASTGGTINWAGDIYLTVIIRGTLSDAELLVLERFVGALTGPTGVKF